MSESNLSLDARIENAQDTPWMKVSLPELVQNKWAIACGLFVFCILVLLILRPPFIFVDRGDEVPPSISWLRVLLVSAAVPGAYMGLVYVTKQ